MEMSHMAPRKLLVTSCWSWYLPRERQGSVDGTADPGVTAAGTPGLGRKRVFAKVEMAGARN